MKKLFLAAVLSISLTLSSFAAAMVQVNTQGSTEGDVTASTYETNNEDIITQTDENTEMEEDNEDAEEVKDSEDVEEVKDSEEPEDATEVEDSKDSEEAKDATEVEKDSEEKDGQEIEDTNSKIYEFRKEFQQQFQEALKELQENLNEIKDDENYDELADELKANFQEKTQELKQELQQNEKDLREKVKQLKKDLNSKKEQYVKNGNVDMQKVKDEIAQQYSDSKKEILQQLKELSKLVNDPEKRQEVLQKAKELRDKLKAIDKEMRQKIQEKVSTFKEGEDTEDPEVENEKAQKIVENSYEKITEQNDLFKEALAKLQSAKESGDKELLSETIKEVQKLYNTKKHESKKAYINVNVVKKAVVSNSNLDMPQNLQDAYAAYVENRGLIDQIHQTIKDAKAEYYKDEIDKLEAKVDELEKENNIDDAIRNYEKVLEKDYNEKTYKKLKELYKKKDDKDLKVYINGKKPNFDVKPFIEDGRTLVPIRQVAEALGAKVEWDGATRTATITKGDKVIKLAIDSNITKVGSKEVKIDVPATIHDGRTVVPLRFVSESFDSNVNWDDQTKLITIEEDVNTDVTTEMDEGSNLTIDDIQVDNSTQQSTTSNTSNSTTTTDTTTNATTTVTQ